MDWLTEQLFLQLCSKVCPLYLHLLCCPADRIICTIFDEIPYRYQLGPTGPMSFRAHVSLIIFYQGDLSIVVSGGLNSWFPLYLLLTLALCIEVFLCWVQIHLKCLYHLLDYHVVFSLSFLMVCISKSILSDLSIAIPAFFWFPCAWNIFLQLITFKLHMSLGLRWVSLYV